MTDVNDRTGSPTFLARTHTGLPIPSETAFTSVEEERRHRKRRLAAALRVFGRLGFGEGISGHVSVRDPGDSEMFWVNPFGVSFNRVTVGDLILVDGAGRVVEGKHRINPSAFVIHSEIHRLRPDVTAIAHAHTMHSRALGALGRLLEPLDQESAAFYQNQVLYSDYQGTSVSLELGRTIAETLGRQRALLLKHHGLITVGGSLEEAVHWFTTFDVAAQVQLLALAAGTPEPLTHEQALAAQDGFGDVQLARFSFNLLWDEILHDQPDFLDE